MMPEVSWSRRSAARVAAMAIAVTVLGGCKGRGKARSAPPDAASTARPRNGEPRARPKVKAGIEGALRRGLEALCKTPSEALLHDTAIAVAAVARAVPWPPALAACHRRIVIHGLEDHDHPLSFLIDPSYRSKVNLARLRKLPPPKPGPRRAPVNRIVHRAAHCRAVGFPAATFTYVTGPMRDQGGYHSTHAMWALLLIRDQRCLDKTRVSRAITSLRAELFAAQTRHLKLRTTRDIDLFAERLLFLASAGSPWSRIKGFVEQLIAAQRTDGVFAAPQEDRMRWKVHATSVAVWALAECLRRRSRRDQKL